MKILVDTHTHTNVSTHAYSTLEENLLHASKIGLEAVAVTNHAPSMPDSPHMWHFLNLSENIPRQVHGVNVLYGAEVDILDTDGNIDLPPDALSYLDVVIASIHPELFAPLNKEAHTQAYLNVLDNPYVDIIGHSGSPDYEYNITAVLEKAKKEHKMIEINNNSHTVRKGNIANCINIAKKCAEMGVYVVVGSDAHFSANIGNFSDATAMLEQINFPEELIANLNLNRFLSILRKRKMIVGL